MEPVGFFSKDDLDGVDPDEFWCSLINVSRNEFMIELEKNGWHRSGYLFLKNDVITLLFMPDYTVKLAKEGYTVFHGKCKNMSELISISEKIHVEI